MWLNLKDYFNLYRSITKQIKTCPFWFALWTWVGNQIYLWDFATFIYWPVCWVISLSASSIETDQQPLEKWVSNVWVTENLTKCSSVLLLCLVRFSMTQTLNVLGLVLEYFTYSILPWRRQAENTREGSQLMISVDFLYFLRHLQKRQQA